LAYISAAGSDLSSFTLLWWAPKEASFMQWRLEWILVVQGHPTSLILAPMENAYATSY